MALQSSLDDPNPFFSLRSEFPGLGEKGYFNYGGQGPLPQSAFQRILETYQFLEQTGPFSLTANRYFQTEMAQLRQTLAEEFQVAPATITLTDNVTAGCNIVLWGLPWQKGDHILMTDCEHPGVIAIVQALSQRFELTYSTCPILATQQGTDPVAVIQGHLTPKTRLVIFSHLLWNNGQVLPLADIIQACRGFHGEYPVQILVDGAQAAGSLPLDFSTLSVDYYAFTGHKWFCGPAGVGGLYVHPERFSELAPTYVGWRSLRYSSSGEVLGWAEDGRRFEVATAAFPQYRGLQAALMVHRQAGTAKDRYHQICTLSATLWQGLQTLPGVHCLSPHPPAAGLVSFEVAGPLSHGEIVQRLEQERFYLRTIVDPSCIRACCHYFTEVAEIDRLLAALKHILA
ncbi:aminotransferase class V-fold PLP-dependent enzyme [Synechocystis sp. LKSZ1]|uniref:aminotransferase class V-fold PLP-dependent enzyme n=1 Tax=Synechocystis sp. LKSZ1 TaxID=3144951 RepID=UPI00336BD2CC